MIILAVCTAAAIAFLGFKLIKKLLLRIVIAMLILGTMVYLTWFLHYW